MDGRIRLPALIALVAMPAFGQDAVTQPAARTLSRIPYSAEGTLERVRTLPDGKQITERLEKKKIYRDSAGRVRIETARLIPTQEGQPNGAPAPVHITISDPVAHVAYTLDIQNRVAHRRIPWPPEKRALPAAGHPHPSHPQFTVERLGDRLIEGLPVTGVRSTTTWPAGSRGIDQATTSFAETWTSLDLHLILLRKESSSRLGDLTQRLTNISRAEPDPKLFQLPADYTVVDDSAARSATIRVRPPVPANEASAPPPPEPEFQPDLARTNPAIVDEPTVETFADAPPAEAPPTDAAPYVGVNAIYVGVSGTQAPDPKAVAPAQTTKTGAPVKEKPKPKKPEAPAPPQ